MATARTLRAPLNWTVAGLGVADLAAAVILSGYAVVLVSGVIHTSHRHGGALAAAGAVIMVAPAAWRRPAPLAAAAVMVAAALLNGLVFGPMVRCGAFLPAVFLVAFAAGVRRDRDGATAGFLLCAAAVVAEGLYDQQIEGPGLVAVLPLLAAFFVSGRLVRARTRTAAALRERPASEPQPTLARLSELLARATSADARLTVDGHPRTLPAGLELSGYRIVEHLLVALRDAPEAAVDVRLNFTPEALELHVSGPPATNVDLRAVLAAARERAGLHGGTVDSRLAGGMCYATARLPLVSGHA
jgi:hypothetical protein